MAAAIFFPAAMRLLAEQQDRRLPSSASAAALRVRSSRPGAFDRHKAAMVAGLKHSKGDFSMTQIGSFTRNPDGSYAGSIKTLAFDVKARLVPSDSAFQATSRPTCGSSSQESRSVRPGAGLRRRTGRITR